MGSRNLNPESGPGDSREREKEDSQQETSFVKGDPSVEDLPAREAKVVFHDGKFGVFFGLVDGAKTARVREGTYSEAEKFLRDRRFADPGRILDKAESHGECTITRQESHEEFGD